MLQKNEFKKEVFKLLASLKILELQKKEIISYINKNLSDKDIKKFTPEKYLNNILSAYGKNNYNTAIIAKALMNFTMFTFLYSIFLVFRSSKADVINYNGFILFSIFLITVVAIPILQVNIRSTLILGTKGLLILARLAIIVLLILGLNYLTYKFDLLNSQVISVNKNMLGIIGVIIMIITQVILKQYKFKLIKLKN